MKRFLNRILGIAEEVLYGLAELTAFFIHALVTGGMILLFVVFYVIPVGISGAAAWAFDKIWRS